MQLANFVLKLAAFFPRKMSTLIGAEEFNGFCGDQPIEEIL
jgi:hypothetical protein